MNAVIIGVLVMLVLSVSRIHVVLSLVIGAFAAERGFPFDFRCWRQAQKRLRGRFRWRRRAGC